MLLEGKIAIITGAAPEPLLNTVPASLFSIWMRPPRLLLRRPWVPNTWGLPLT